MSQKPPSRQNSMSHRLGLVLIAVLSTLALVHSFPLDDYVWRPDPNYSWFESGVRLSGKGLRPQDSWTGYVLNMTSQAWLTDADFSPASQTKSIWTHTLVVIVPDTVLWTRNATLYLTGGNNDPNFVPKADDEDIVVTAALAMANNVVAGCLFHIPNQHVIFASDPKQQSRGEDAVIAFTWSHFLNDQSNPEWLLRFPMVKASVRAMDTITAFGKSFGYSLDYFVVAGASKRGWTTWDVGIVDSTGPLPGRVTGIVPIVLDAINFKKTIHHQFRSYGNWSFALKDYTEMNVTERLDGPGAEALEFMIDPYYHKERLTMPKLVVNAVLDEFQQPDDTLYWWDGMPEPKHFLICPNAEHSEATGVLEIVPAISVWIEYHLKGQYPVPKFSWNINPNTGAISAVLDQNGVVASADLWYAQSCGVNHDGTNRRDFRVIHKDNPCTCGISAKGMCLNLKSLWNKVSLNATINKQGMREYDAMLPAPADGTWVAYMILITYENAYGTSQPIMLPGRPAGATPWTSKGFPPIPIDLPGKLAFTTEVSVWPQTFPYADCVGASCGTGLC